MDASRVKSLASRPPTSLLRHVRWEHLLAGVSGGVVSTLVLHPLDLVKIRFQVNEGLGSSSNRPQYTGIRHALLSIGRQDGISGLYRGVTPNVWGAGASWGLYFFFYNALKTWMQDGDSKTALTPGHHLLAASEAGLVTLIFTNPIWVTKTRLCLQYETSATTVVPPEKNYRGMLDALIKIYKYEGLRGWYRGFLPGAFGVSHGALQFMAYEEMKNRYNQHMNRAVDYRLSSFEYIIFAALSKMFAAVATYPYQVVRSRLQDQHRSYNGAMDVIRQTWRFERLGGFYKGVSAYLVHVTPNICIVFLMYEYICHKIRQPSTSTASSRMTSQKNSTPEKS